MGSTVLPSDKPFPYSFVLGDVVVIRKMTNFFTNISKHKEKIKLQSGKD